MAEIFGGLPRLAPGSNAATMRVLDALDGIPEEARVLDVGAGTGAQSVVLAQALPNARITALDVNEHALGVLMQRAAQANVAGRISTHVGPMHAMDFPIDAFDLIWSEGSAYIMGFANALRKWKPLIRKNGYVVISECTWLTIAPSARAQDFWDAAYPAMQTLQQNLDLIAEAGYDLITTYTVPPAAWEDEYYALLEPRLAALPSTYPAGSREHKALMRIKDEIEIFRTHSDQFGYVFYALRKP